MRTSHKILLMSVAAVVFWAGFVGSALSTPQDPTQESIAQGNNAFALALYASLSEREGNLFFSPFSVSSALAMAYAGGRGNTAKQMAHTLHFQSEPAQVVKPLGDMIRDLRDRGKTQQYELNLGPTPYG